MKRSQGGEREEDIAKFVQVRNILNLYGDLKYYLAHETPYFHILKGLW